MKFQLHERIFNGIFAPGNIGEMGLHYTKLEEMSRSAVIQKTKLPSHSNSVFFPSNNKKRKIPAQRDFLKCEQFQPEHKAPKHHVEVAMIDLHRIPESYIPVNRGSLHPPRRSGHLRVDEVESRGWGRRAPQSPSSSSFGAPQGNNEIYKCDAVFRIGENQNKRYKPNAVSL